MIISLINKIKIRLEVVKDRVKIFLLKKKIKKLILSNKINTIPFYKLVINYIKISDKKNEYAALGYLKNKVNSQSKNNFNLIEYLLPKQKMPLPSFFRNNISAFNIDKCLGIGEVDNQKLYEKILNNLDKKTNDLDCNYFISLISKKKSFHYLKFTHGFWDRIVNYAIKEHALKNGKEFVMKEDLCLYYYIFNNNLISDLFELVSSNKFIDMVKNRNIYFCPTTSNASIGAKIEFKIMKDLSRKNFLYHYSQVMLMEEFSRHKEITSSNLFKKIICTDSLRDLFLKEIKDYDLILICNHRAASKISKIFPNFKKIYCLPDIGQDLKHLAKPMKFAKDVCMSVLSSGSSKPTLILSQASLLSTFISYEILTNYKEKNISLIDIGKPLQTLFSPEIIAGGKWRDANNLSSGYMKMSHLISDDILSELKIDTKAQTRIEKFKIDMDIENQFFNDSKTLF